MPAKPLPAVLSIAGSDSGGGAGIQADLKAFARCGVHGMTAIAALTAQNTVAVTGVHPVPGDFIVEQVRAVAEDIGVDAVKIGMLGTAETVEAVATALDLLEPGTPIVIDPVMVAESGAVLLDDPARAAIVAELLPRATVITPNLPEARVLVATAGTGRGGEPGTAGGGEPGTAGGGETDGPTTSRPSPAPCTPSARPTWSSPAATATRRPTSSSTARPARRSRAPATPTAPPTAPAAPTARRSPPTSPTASRRSNPPAPRAGSPARRCSTASGASAAAPGPSTSCP